MSVHFISGKPGGGKTLYSVRLIIDELLHGTRMIITNVPLNLGELNAYLEKEYPAPSGGPYWADILRQRIRILDDDEAAVFWTIRPACKIERLAKKDWEAGRKPDYSAAGDKGVMYVIDEVQNFFGARQWMQTGQDVLFYLSQHRKLGDTVVCITQAVANVDKQFRSVTQDFTWIKNLSKERYGMFRLPSLFIRKTFSSPPSENAQPMETGTFKLDVRGIAACYNTAQGVGIHAQVADRSERPSGKHWVYGLLVVVLGVLAYFLIVPSAVAHFFKTPAAVLAKSSPAQTTNNPVHLPSARVDGLSAAIGQEVSGGQLLRSNSVSLTKGVELKCTGFFRLGSKILITMSDGRVLKQTPHGSFTNCTDTTVWVDGKPYARP